jgi:hypothetical protein
MTRPGCYNRPPLGKPLVVQDGYYEREERGAPVKIPRYVYAEFRMTVVCQWSMTNNHPTCKGCIHKFKKGK